MKLQLLTAIFLVQFLFGSCLSAQSVEIVRDKYWVPHIIGDTPRECGYGLGRAMSEDHPKSTIDNVLMLRGRMAEAYGASFFSDDVRVRASRIAKTGAEAFAGLPSQVADYYSGFALGVNDYFQEHPEKLPAEVQALDFLPLTGADFYSLYSLYTFNTQWFEFSRDAGALLDGNAQNMAQQPARPENSNQWAIAPPNTADGATYVLIDPHLPFDGLPASYEAHLISRDSELDFEGRFAVGSPYTVSGHNRFVAFSGTSNTPDFADAYVVLLDPNDPNAYLLDGQSKPFTTWKETFSIAAQPDSTITFKASQDHGVVVKRLANGQVLMARLEVLEAEPAGLQTFRMMTARSVDDMQAALRLHQFHKGNSVVADAQGNIAFTYRARSHYRANPAAARGAALDGSTSATLWGELIPFDVLPGVTNPASHWLQNCNDAPWYVTDQVDYGRADVAAELYAGDSFGVRGKRATELIKAGLATIDMGYAKAIALDHKIVAWDSVRSVLQTALQESANDGYDRQQEAEAHAALLFNWDARATTDSKAMSLFVEWFLLLEDQMKLLNPAAIGSGKRRTMVEELVHAADLMQSYHGSDRVPWGQIHGLERNGVWYPVSGGRNSEIGTARLGVWKKRDSQNRFTVQAGNNFMMVIRLKAGESPQAWTMKPYGQSADPASPHYADLTELFSANSLRKTFYDEADFRANTVKTETFVVTSVTDNSENENPAIPKTVQLAAYPNPFNPSTKIQFELPRNSEVQLVVFDVIGRLVDELAAGKMSAGRHSLTWQPERSLSSGAYFLRLNLKGSRVVMKKVLFLK